MLIAITISALDYLKFILSSFENNILKAILYPVRLNNNYFILFIDRSPLGVLILYFHVDFFMFNLIFHKYYLNSVPPIHIEAV